MANQKIIDTITKMRKEIMAHSYIYYVIGDNILEDYQYDMYGRELAKLQKKHPEEASEAEFANAFAEYTETSTSGFDLPFMNADIIAMAEEMLENR